MKTLAQVEPRAPISSLPFIITNRGSYYLTTNLNGSPSFTNGITIKAGDVTVDLMGFAIAGGTGDGIFVSDSVTNIAVRNGTVRNWSSDGVDTFNGRNSQLERLRVSGNGRGINVGVGTIINNCNAYANVGVGIMTTIGDTVIGCNSYLNGDDGISVSSSCTVSTSTARLNSGNGIATSTGCTITACTAYDNGSNGIYATVSCTVSGCTTVFNGADGIAVTNNCRVVDNTCNSNGNQGNGAGIHATGSHNRVDNNNVTGNDRGIDVDGTDNLIIRNSASGNTTNFDIVAANKVGPIVTPPDSVAISGDTGGAGLGSTNPWANFAF